MITVRRKSQASRGSVNACRLRVAALRTLIEIEAGEAFGTAHNTTTALCLVHDALHILRACDTLEHFAYDALSQMILEEITYEWNTSSKLCREGSCTLLP
jgi:hypothetical protein